MIVIGDDAGRQKTASFSSTWLTLQAQNSRKIVLISKLSKFDVRTKNEKYMQHTISLYVLFLGAKEFVIYSRLPT